MGQEGNKEGQYRWGHRKGQWWRETGGGKDTAVSKKQELFVVVNLMHCPFLSSKTIVIHTVFLSIVYVFLHNPSVICVTCFALFEVRKTRLMLQKIQHLYFLKQATTISCATWQRDTNSFSLPIQVPRIVERLTFFN